MAALLVLLATLGFWFAKGHHWGFNVNTVFDVESDPVTGLEKRTPRAVFIPGYEFLAEGAAATAVFFGASFFFRKKKAP